MSEASEEVSALFVDADESDEQAVKVHGNWARLLCNICETVYEPTSFTAPLRFTCDVCGAVNRVAQ